MSSPRPAPAFSFWFFRDFFDEEVAAEGAGPRLRQGSHTLTHDLTTNQRPQPDLQPGVRVGDIGQKAGSRGALAAGRDAGRSVKRVREVIDHA
jgi:hypothetical protein